MENFWDFREMSLVEFIGRYLKKNTITFFTESIPKMRNGTDKNLQPVLRAIEFHNSGSAGAYMMFKGATSRTDVSSTGVSAATHLVSACVYYSL